MIYIYIYILYICMLRPQAPLRRGGLAATTSATGALRHCPGLTIAIIIITIIIIIVIVIIIISTIITNSGGATRLTLRV